MPSNSPEESPALPLITHILENIYDKGPQSRMKERMNLVTLCLKYPEIALSRAIGVGMTMNKGYPDSQGDLTGLKHSSYNSRRTGSSSRGKLGVERMIKTKKLPPKLLYSRRKWVWSQTASLKRRLFSIWTRTGRNRWDEGSGCDEWNCGVSRIMGCE